MALNLTANTVISADAKGVIEYWDVDSFQMPKVPKISFEYKTETGMRVQKSAVQRVLTSSSALLCSALFRLVTSPMLDVSCKHPRLLCGHPSCDLHVPITLAMWTSLL